MSPTRIFQVIFMRVDSCDSMEYALRNAFSALCIHDWPLFFIADKILLLLNYLKYSNSAYNHTLIYLYVVKC
jgi:hypothetical protein